MTTNTLPSGASGSYLFNNDAPEAKLQVKLLAEILDEHTQAVLGAVDINADGRCLDLGGGAGTIAGWMADMLVPRGEVEVLDINPRHTTAGDRVTITAADLTTYPLGEGRYDVIHARLLFMHLPDREQLVARAAAALRPGGTLVISDWDTTRLADMIVRAPADVAGVFHRFQEALISTGVAGGMDPGWARRVPAVMANAGLVAIDGETHTRLWRGGTDGMQLHACNSRQKHAALLEAGMTICELELLREAMTDPDVWAWMWPMHTTTGIRPHR